MPGNIFYHSDNFTSNGSITTYTINSSYSSVYSWIPKQMNEQEKQNLIEYLFYSSHPQALLRIREELYAQIAAKMNHEHLCYKSAHLYILAWLEKIAIYQGAYCPDLRKIAPNFDGSLVARDMIANMIIRNYSQILEKIYIKKFLPGF